MRKVLTLERVVAHEGKWLTRDIVCLENTIYVPGEKTLTSIDIITGESKTVVENKEHIFALAFTEDKTHILCASHSNLYIFRISDSKLISETKIGEDWDSIKNMKMHKAHDLFTAGDNRGDVHHVNIKDLKKPVVTRLFSHNKCMIYAHNGVRCIHQLITKPNLYLFAGAQGTYRNDAGKVVQANISVVDVEKKELTARYDISESKGLLAITSVIETSVMRPLDPKEKNARKRTEYVVTGTYQGESVFLINLEGEVVRKLKISSETGYGGNRIVSFCKFSGAFIFIGLFRGRILSFFVDQSQVIIEPSSSENKSQVSLMTMSGDGERLITSGHHGKALNVYKIDTEYLQQRDIRLYQYEEFYNCDRDEREVFVKGILNEKTQRSEDISVVKSQGKEIARSFKVFLM